MTLAAEDYKNLLAEKGLKVTPQRISVLEAVYTLHNHPTAEMIREHIRTTHPNIATGTVYKVLDVLVGKALVRRVKTDKDIMRYDGMMESHHHLYCSDTERIEDYIDEELDDMLREYFSRKKIRNFQIEEIKLQINGKFKTPKS
jgi:Fur family peroxide stress response transcriptional regulator